MSERDQAGARPQLRAAPTVVGTRLTCFGSSTSGCWWHRRKTRALAVLACPTVVPVFQGWFGSHSAASRNRDAGSNPPSASIPWPGLDPLAWPEAGVRWSQHIRHVPRAGRGPHASETSTGALTLPTTTQRPWPRVSLRIQLRNKGTDACPPQPHTGTGARPVAEANAKAHIGHSGKQSGNHQREKRSAGRHEYKTHFPLKRCH